MGDPKEGKESVGDPIDWVCSDPGVFMAREEDLAAAVERTGVEEVIALDRSGIEPLVVVLLRAPRLGVEEEAEPREAG